MSKWTDQDQRFYYAASRINRGDIASGLPEIQILADEGYIFAKSLLADLYLEGEGVKKSPRKALKLYVEAALAGDGRAAMWAATMCDKGLEVEKNKELASVMHDLIEESGYKPPRGSVPKEGPKTSERILTWFKPEEDKL